MSKNFTTHPLHYSVYTRSCAREILNMIGVKKGKRLLDVGCGIGYNLERAKEGDQGLEVFGLEYDLDSVNYSAKRVEANLLNADAGTMPFRDSAFDKVLSVSVLEHVKDDEKAVKELVRVCQEKGELIISVPSKDGLRSFSRLRNLGHEDPDSAEYHFRVGYSKKELIELLEKNGIQIIKCQYSLILTAEIIMDLVKWIYLKKNKFKSQKNIYEATKSPLFLCYKAIFPLILITEYLEKLLLGGFFKGHIINIYGIVHKS